MQLHILDIAFFLTFFIIVIGLSLIKSRKEKTGEDFFLAGRNLTWPFIGLSLIAANISSEQLIGQAGDATARVGLAMASWDWIAAASMVLIAIFFLPKFLKIGIYTLPEFFEYRFNSIARAILAIYTIFLMVFILPAGVVYSGAVALNTIFGMNLTLSVWLIGGIAALYTAWGGLKAVAWADLFQGSALILGGFVILILGLTEVGGITAFREANAVRLHTILPANADIIPWTALIFAAWLPNLYYWGTNQFMTQKVLAAQNLKQGQYGILFAAALKLIMPFIIVIPGIIAIQLYGDQLAASGSDSAYPFLIKNLVPMGLRGFIFAALAGAIISTLASMLNSSSTIFTIDLIKRNWNKNAGDKQMVLYGRMLTLVFVIICCLIAPLINKFEHGVFQFMQEFGSYILPGGIAAFLFGLFVKRSSALVGNLGLVMSFFTFGMLHIFDPASNLLPWFTGHPHEIWIRMGISTGYILMILFPAWFIMPKHEEYLVTGKRLRKNKMAGLLMCILTIPAYGVMTWLYGKEIVWLNRVAISFGIIVFVMTVITLLCPLQKPVILPERKDFVTVTDRRVLVLGMVILTITGLLYAVFR